MNLIITALKVKLEPFGWTEILQRGGKKGNAPNVCGMFGEGGRGACACLLGDKVYHLARLLSWFQ